MRDRTIAVEAGDVPALATDPVDVEQRRAADVAHLTNAVHGSFPCNLTYDKRSVQNTLQCNQSTIK